MRKPPFPDMDELLQRLLDDQIQPDEMDRLQKAMRENSRVRDYYVDSMLACAVIRRSSQVTGEFSESELIQAIAQDESPGGFRRRARYLYSVAAILILGMMLLTSLHFFRQWARGPAIGVLTGIHEVQWRGAHPHPGGSLFVGPYHLREGAAKMELNRGTGLLLEAPCQVELTDMGELILKRGRLTVVVSSQAKGFRVLTRTAQITDLGTEFGVIAHPDGSTETHVLKGRVRIALNSNRSSRSTSQVVNEGLAAVVDASGGAIQGGLPAQSDLFLLQLPSARETFYPKECLNLADIVGGGNGRGSGTLGRGINAGTGQVFRPPVTKIQWIRRNEYHLTEDFRGIDGVFVPNKALGRVAISSAGLLFSQWPDTHGSYYGGPANGGTFFDLLSRETFTARFNGVRFGTSRHPALSLHANAGITFDLDEIRQDHPTIPIKRFTAMCGIPKDLPHPRFSPADVWVLLDGVVSLHVRFPTEQSVIEKVDVPIPDRARFLTLASTCSGRADYSWIIFGDPFLGPVESVLEEDTP